MTHTLPRISLALVLALLCGGTAAFAQVKPVRPGELDAHLDSLFTAGKFNELEVEALRLLHPSRNSSEQERVAAHLFLGFTWELADRDDDAQNAFLQALTLRPSLALDEVYVPPRLFEAFERARRNFLATKRRPIVSALSGETASPPGHTLGTVLNVLLPGSGFVASGKTLHGLAWTTVQLGCAGEFAYVMLQTSDARTDYLGATAPFDIKQKYKTYNTWYRRAWIWGAATAAIYIGAQIDYQLSGVSFSVHPTSLGDPNQPKAGLGVQLRF